MALTLETGGGLHRAQANMRRKGTDITVPCDASAPAASRANVTNLGKDDSVRRLRGRAEESRVEVLADFSIPA